MAIFKITLFITFVFTLFVSVWAADPEWEKAQKEIRKELRSKDISVQLTSVDRLSSFDTKESATFILEMMSKRSTSGAVVDRLGDILSNFSSEPAKAVALRWIKANATGNGNPKIYESIAKMNITETQIIFANIIKKTKQKQSLLIIALSAFNEFESLSDPVEKDILNLISDQNAIPIRRAAVTVLGKSKNKNVVTALLPFLNDTNLKFTTRESLTRLIGKDLGSEFQKWDEYMKNAGESFQVAGIPLETARSLMEESYKKEAAVPSSRSFFGIEVSGKNIIFILDKSGSMLAPSGSTDSVTRMDTLKEQLNQLLETLSQTNDNTPASRYGTSRGKKDNPSFQLIFFSHDVQSFPSKTTSSFAKDEIEKAQSFIKNVKAESITEMMLAWKEAVSICEKQPIDTIYFLSDGSPTGCTEEELISFISSWNYGKGVAIHCISIGSPSGLMKIIADNNKGQYREVR